MTNSSVLLINRVYPPHRGATGRMARDLARALAKDGHRVTVLTTGPKTEEVHENGVRVMRLRGPDKPRHVLGYLWIFLTFLIRSLRLSSHDVVITMTDPPLLVLVGQILQSRKSSKHIHWCQDLYPDLFPVIGVSLPGSIMDFLKKHTRKAMKRADGVVAIGDCMSRYLSHHGVHQHRIDVIPNWPDPVLVDDGFEDNTGQDRSPEQLPPHKARIQSTPKFRVLYAGNLGRAHPITPILNAARIIQNDLPDVEFVFAGGGPGFVRLEKARTRMRLNNIRFIPYQPDHKVKTMMQTGDVHLVSMRTEAAGLLVPSKIYAAIAVGRPCILIGPGGTEAAKLVTHHQIGQIVSGQDGQALADAIRSYRTSSDRWFAAHNGARAAAQDYQPNNMLNRWITYTKRVIETQQD